MGRSASVVDELGLGESNTLAGYIFTMLESVYSRDIPRTRSASLFRFSEPYNFPDPYASM